LAAAMTLGSAKSFGGGDSSALRGQGQTPLLQRLFASLF
jgi:hypothetical protein